MSKTKIEDYEAIIEVVNHYITGSATGDVAELKLAFHDKCTMTGYINGEMYMGDIHGFYGMVEQVGAPSADFRAKADVVAVEGTVAVAHVAFDNWHGMSFTDYHTLIKEDGTWKIIAKAYHQFVEA